MSCRRRQFLPVLPALLTTTAAVEASPAAALVAPPLRVVYPRPVRDVDRSSLFPLQLLKLALDASGVRCELSASKDLMVQSRALKELEAPQDHLHIAWSMTSVQREQSLLPVRIPIFKGLYGWRVLLIKQGQQAAWSEVDGLDGLKRFTLVQGHDWPDTEILRANGLTVTTGSSFAALFKMLDMGRAQAFPRSVLEAGWEQEGQKQLFAVEPKLVLHYPTAVYFFVRPGDQRLAALVELGLNRLLANGGFDRLFDAHHAEPLRQAGLHKRRVIELHNPLLPEQTPLARKELWRLP
ncbi:transporter substrate-binding domain-containing protein [Paucibacter sp. TC2R-5]|uniref:substrate-binding periplasmic protein n=1 Tax=Paucibacter sp. TC2R-5 TaxID=2893555 RepID=UPI0021E3FA6D|nr:transporter substrate-binding domain-containing protein [Paucibacter sp. TC2R-5]MCV2359575.1 transporter substrate-binding domain-containing protein [Paucibacter sp. TC2R-5]